ncbi:U11/U12 small nuclear ribonucleoprotein 48 kDa protein isoform 3-T4 [Liasis olivaceus]
MVSPLNLGEIEARVPFPKMAAAADSPVGKSLLSFSLWFGTPYEKVTCPYDANHQMPKSSLEKHMISCRLRKLEYSKEEEAEMYDSSFFYEKGKIPKVQMDKDLQFDIIKKAMAKECGNYCPETKNQRSRSQMTENDSDLFVDLAAKVNQDDGQKGPKSHLEILAEMRDYKRRRQSYRAKNVHITKKSYTEVIRDVIGVHMEELATHWQEENRNTEVHEDEKSSFSAKSSGRKSEGLHQLIPDNLVEVQRILIILDIGGIPAEVQADEKEVEKEKEREIPEGKEREMKESIVKEENNTCISITRYMEPKLSCICFIPEA